MYPRQWVVQDLIPEDNVTLLTGDGGTGKSLLSLQLAMAAALGRSWVEQETARRKVLAVFCGDSQWEFHRRREYVLRHYGAKLGDLGDMRLMRKPPPDNILMEFPGPFERGETTSFFQHVKDTAAEHEVGLIVLDSAEHLFAGNGNNPSHVWQFVRALRGLAWEMGILLTANSSLLGCNSGTGEPGSTAWSDVARSWLHLHKPKGAPDEIMLTHLKSNYSRSGTQIHLHWDAGVFVALGTQKANRPRCGR